MAEYRTKDGMYHLHGEVEAEAEAGTGKKARGARKGSGAGIVHSHAKVAFAYHLGSGRLITHGTPESTAAWADAHHESGGDRMAVIAFDGVSAEEVNAAIADHEAWVGLKARLGVEPPQEMAVEPDSGEPEPA